MLVRVVSASVLALALGGCTSSSSSGASGAGEDRGAVSVQGLSPRDVDLAVRDFVRAVSERDAQGWPPRIALDSYGKPMARVDMVTNRTREHLDTYDIASRLRQALVDAGIVAVAPPQDEGMGRTDDREEAAPRPDRAGMADEGEGEAGADDDRVALIVTGSITDEREEVDGTVSVSYWIHFEMTNTADRSVIASSRTKIRRSRAVE